MPRHHPTESRSERITVGVVLVVILGLYIAEVATNYEPRKLTALWFVMLWFPLLALHEAGHAVTAAALGWRVRRVVIGMGPPLKQWVVRGVPVELRIFPVEGFVIPEPRPGVATRSRCALIYLAGPGAELALLGLVTLALGTDTMLSRSDHQGVLLAQTLGVAVLLSAFVNLVPHRSSEPGGETLQSDGLGVLRSLFGPAPSP